MDNYEVINCFKCGRIFRKTDGSNKCKKCIEEDRELLEDIRIYILEHPDVDIYEISDKFNVSKREILNLIDEDRIQVKPDNSNKMTYNELYNQKKNKGKYGYKR